MMGRRARRITPALALVVAASAVAAWAYWSAPGTGVASVTSASLDAAAISVPASGVTTITVSWTQQASLQPTSPENSAITYSVERRLDSGSWVAVSGGGCSGALPYGVVSCSDSPPATGSYSFRVVAAYRQWTATSNSAGPVSFTLDTVPPVNVITLAGVVGGAFKSGATVYYRGSASGSFTLTNALTDSATGPASSATAALAGPSTGWTHSPSVVSTPVGGPYVSTAFAWSPVTTSSPSETVTGSDAVGNTAATTLTFTDDSVAPAGGTVDANGLSGTGGRYATSTALSIALVPGIDAGSGLGTGAQLLRASASLGDGSCGTYGVYSQIGANDPVSPAADTVPVDHTCYRYQYVVLDRVGNQATYTSPDIKVDTTAPHPDFLQPITSPETVKAGPAGLAVGDVDNDGDPDIVTSSIFTALTSVLINNGVGSFRETTVVSNGATIDVGLGKFDNDSNLDLVLLYQQTPPATGLLIIFKGGGDGTFTYMFAANEIVNTGVRSTALAVGNFNGDTIDDVAVVNSQNTPDTTAGTVMTFLGNPAGNNAFAAATPAQTQNAQIGASDIAFADFNGGAGDLVVTNYVSNTITFLAGNGTGFNAPANIATGASLFSLDTEYLDAGTNRDIVATVRNSSPSAVRTLFGDGAGAFPTQATTTAATATTGTGPIFIVAKDFDGDGDADVAFTNTSPATVSVLANNGTGTLTIAPASPEVGVGGVSTLPFGIASADFDGSGYNDLAVGPVFTSPGEVRMLLNQNGNRANLSIAQTDSPDPVRGGQDLTYTLTVANAGPNTPSSVKTTDRLPTGVTFNAAASSPTCSAAGTAPVTVTCNYGVVAPGSPESQQIVVTTSAASSTLTNTATVAGNLADATPADNISTTTTVVDAAGPSGGSVDASGLVGTGGRYSTSTALSIVLAKGTDPSGLATTGAQLRRSTATLTSGTCGVYSVSAQIGANDPVSPVANTVPAAQACYRYEYVVADALGNSTTYVSADVKIDTNAPSAPTFAYSALTNTYWNGSTLYYRSNAASGAFTVTAGSTDTESGIASYAFPTLPAGWASAAGALGVNTYSWSVASPTAPAGVQNATATNNAGLTSAAVGFTLTSDVTAPATGTVSLTSGYYASLSVSVSFTHGTDGASGVNITSGLVQRADTTLTAGACGSYGLFTTVAARGTNPTSPFADASVVSGNCYQYRYLVSDNVGNQATYTSASVAKVDSTPPSISRSIAAKTSGIGPGTIRQGGDYYLYAEVTDTASSVATVTANASSFDTGVTAASLSATGGPWTVGGLSYGYRSAILTANTGLTTGTTPSYTITAADAAGNIAGPTSYLVTIETYNSVIAATAGLVSYWRFNDGAISGDEFTDTAGVVLSSHTGAVGATWTSVSGQARTAVISTGGRVRKETGNGAAQYYASAAPASANYLVQGDVYGVSGLATDVISVVGRQDISGTGQTYYLARYVVDLGRWELAKVVGGTLTLIGTGTGTGFYTQNILVATSYRMTLQMNGTAISLLVDGVPRITATDSAIAAAGRGGVIAGTSTSTAQVSDGAGLHLDNFRITSLGTNAADSRGTNNGTFTNAPLLNEPGALAGDSDRAAKLDGTNDYVAVPDASSLDLGDGPLTLEAWVKRSNVNTAGISIFQKGALAVQFGFFLDNTFLSKDNTGTVASSTVTVTGTNWHHLVVTKSGAAAKLYIDGIDRTGTVTNFTLADTAAALILGAKNGTSEFLAATIDEFAVYNAALSLATVLDHYKAGAGTG